MSRQLSYDDHFQCGFVEVDYCTLCHNLTVT